MAAEKTLDTLFHDTLKDIYYAERTILKALPKMARGAQSTDLKQAFEKHKDETQGHVERLQQVFELIGKRAQGKTSREALRCLKRRLADVVYRQLVRDARPAPPSAPSAAPAPRA